ncbi:permease, partial [Staphylococcus capitis]|uniref:metalloprotease family protein n=1 Tax=Staphylococcus capitis TaxID=29388 RepID=UPI000D4AEAD7
LFILFSKGEKPSIKYNKRSIIMQFSITCFNRWQFTTIMLAPLVIISLTLLILIQMYSYSSLIFMFSIHMSYCMIDVFLVALALTSKFKYVQKYDEGLYLYQSKPTQANHE